MAHKVSVEMPQSDLGKKEIKIHVNREGGVLGKLYIGKAGIIWMPRGKKTVKPGEPVNVKWLDWRGFAKLMVKEGRDKTRHQSD